MRMIELSSINKSNIINRNNYKIPRQNSLDRNDHDKELSNMNRTVTIWLSYSLTNFAKLLNISLLPQTEYELLRKDIRYCKDEKMSSPPWKEL